MSRFIGNLELGYVQDAKGAFLTNPMGRQLYDMELPFSYQSDLLGCIITVPKGFVTDLASIPRLPFIYLCLNGIADQAGIIHDYLYSTGLVSREMADAVLREACLVLGVPVWKAEMIYAGVRTFGGAHYSADYVV